MPKAAKTNSKPVKSSNQKVTTVTLAQAAAHCNVSPNNFKYHVDRHPDLPIEDKSRGHQGWRISLEKLDEWRKRTGYMMPKQAEEEGANNPTRDRMQAQADLIRMQVEEKKGKLISKEWAIQEVSTGMALLAKEMDLMPVRVGKKAGLSREAIDILKKEMNDARAAMVLRLVNADLLPK